jgi:hypothetical protein
MYIYYEIFHTLSINQCRINVLINYVKLKVYIINFFKINSIKWLFSVRIDFKDNVKKADVHLLLSFKPLKKFVFGIKILPSFVIICLGMY